MARVHTPQRRRALPEEAPQAFAGALIEADGFVSGVMVAERSTSSDDADCE